MYDHDGPAGRLDEGGGQEGKYCHHPRRSCSTIRMWKLRNECRTPWTLQLWRSFAVSARTFAERITKTALRSGISTDMVRLPGPCARSKGLIMNCWGSLATLCFRIPIKNRKRTSDARAAAPIKTKCVDCAVLV